MQSRNPTWDKSIAEDWKYVVPPSRPSMSELAVVERQLRKFPKKSKLLILGSTAEFRDLAYVNKFDTTIVDYNLSVYQTLKQCLRQFETDDPSLSPPYVIKSEENNWLEMEYEAEFDIVLGDLAVNMLPMEQHGDLVRIITRALKSNGVSIQRIWTRLPEKYCSQTIQLEDLFREHEQDQERRGYDYFYSLALPLISFFHDPQKQETRFQDILQKLKELKDDKTKPGLVNEDCWRAFFFPWHRYELPNRLPLKSDIELTIKNHSQIFSIEYGEDFFKDMCPIYLFGKPTASGQNPRK